ncbi:MAG TPA: mycothiol conjugate amidase Mca [Acidimicrobiales bacterium]|nr:mycothiol conjugate amidase Mca [Acidimicrobiales bacterium]
MGSRLSLLTVHAHPDDESSKGAGTVSLYASQGVRTTLVCCTGGEEGDILNPAMDLPEVRDRLGDVRRDELATAAKIIGYDEVVMLGYRDSGMPDSEANTHPEAFANAPLDEAVGRLVEVIRREQPQVVVTYGDDQQGYPHPDHLRVHDITLPAFELAADPDAYPELGDPWQTSKLYYTMWSRARVVAMHEKFLELGLESPFGEDWFKRPSQEQRITTSVSLSGRHADVRGEALRAHATQVDPTSPFWFGLPPEVMREVHPYDDYELARSLVDSTIPEDDLFAGLR